MHHSGTLQALLALVALLGEDVAVISLAPLQFTASCQLETLLGTAVWFHLRHTLTISCFTNGVAKILNSFSY